MEVHEIFELIIKNLDSISTDENQKIISEVKAPIVALYLEVKATQRASRFKREIIDTLQRKLCVQEGLVRELRNRLRSIGEEQDYDFDAEIEKCVWALERRGIAIVA